MFCSECGKQADGKFCWNCGAPLQGGGGAQPQASAAPATDWQDEVDYAKITQVPEVRDRLAKQKPATVRMTGEDFVESFDKLLKSPVSLAPVIDVMQDVYGRLGIHTSKSRSQPYGQPVGRVIVAALCSLAKGGYTLQDVRQASDGCMLICAIPSDMFSLAGQLLVTIQRESQGASVHASTRIEGQMFDWGKSTRCLNELFKDIEAG